MTNKVYLAKLWQTKSIFCLKQYHSHSLYLPLWSEQTPHRWWVHPLAKHTEWIRSSPVAQHLFETPPSRLPCPSTAPGQLERQMKQKDTEQKTKWKWKKDQRCGKRGGWGSNTHTHTHTHTRTRTSTLMHAQKIHNEYIYVNVISCHQCWIAGCLMCHNVGH